MLNLRKINTADFKLMIENLGTIKSTSDSIKNFSNNPSHITLYNEMMKSSKEELETPLKSTFNELNLYKTIIKHHSYLAFAALMEKNAFIEELLPENKWLIENCPVKNLDFYECLLSTESPRFFNPNKGYEGLSFTLSHMYKYFNSLEEVEVNQLSHNIYNSFNKEKAKELNYFVFNNVTSKMGKSLLNIFLKNNYDINQDNYLNNYLPQENFHSTTFFISSSSVSLLKDPLEAGYRFNEEIYSFKGKSLMENLLESDSSHVLPTVFPYLTRAKPFVMSYGEQHNLLEKFKKLSNFEEIQEQYFSLVEQEYDRVIPQKKFNNEKKKI